MPGHQELCLCCGFLSCSRQVLGCAWRGSNPALALHPEVVCGYQQGIWWWLCCSPQQCWLFLWQGCCTLSIGDPGLCWVSQPSLSSFLWGQEELGFLPVQGWGSGAAVVRKAFPLLQLPPSPTVIPTLGHRGAKLCWAALSWLLRLSWSPPTPAQVGISDCLCSSEGGVSPLSPWDPTGTEPP